MKKKQLTRSLILLISAVLILGGCGKDNETKQESANNQAAGNTAEQPTSPVEPESAPESAKETMSWDSPPAMEIDTNKAYTAKFTTSKGDFTIELFAKDAPKTVNNFVFLSRQGFYNDVIFHRIIETFMIQTGDPEGTGAGGPGYSFEDEQTEHKYEPGIVAMANAGPDTNGSQFFICTGDDSIGLNNTPNFTIFGKVTNGMDVVEDIAATPVEPGGPMGELSTPTETVQIKEIQIVEQ
ncbi:cyclophilin family peptidyl-prolyl cis-trans isomerase [Fontibacillus phaseoli]|uniref:Peptidyl-prolyl cis-trans isomerase n=1 Tax=Fontibacillus phaseoli TaxID=1416533 RepID=A0A369BPY3_9BACL|nr:peptidylprolyl isomerase [Fontibacillus phaseoli]RCX23689.1 cyclophilin family peptidyl-prolyl cis-trans isomerase [Fontibacillus phaseoli]